jgi:hypothetical protein
MSGGRAEGVVRPSHATGTSRQALMRQIGRHLAPCLGENWLEELQ